MVSHSADVSSNKPVSVQMVQLGQIETAIFNLTQQIETVLFYLTQQIETVLFYLTQQIEAAISNLTQKETGIFIFANVFSNGLLRC